MLHIQKKISSCAGIVLPVQLLSVMIVYYSLSGRPSRRNQPCPHHCL